MAPLDGSTARFTNDHVPEDEVLDDISRVSGASSCCGACRGPCRADSDGQDEVLDAKPSAGATWGPWACRRGDQAAPEDEILDAAPSVAVTWVCCRAEPEDEVLDAKRSAAGTGFCCRAEPEDDLSFRR